MSDDDIPGARFAGELEEIAINDILIPLESFITFLGHTGRSTQCPMCPHKGEWLVHAHDEDGEQAMNIYTMGDPREKDSVYPMIALECPRCGFTPLTSAIKVTRFMAGGNDE